MRMPDFTTGPRSQALVVLVIVLISFLQSIMTYNVTFGGLSAFAPEFARSPLEIGWFAVRLVLVMSVVVLWLLGRRRSLFRAIIVANSFLTAGLLVTTTTLIGVLFGFSAKGAADLLSDVVLLATANILIFSIWYWIIDPPGIETEDATEKRWDFLFPQRSSSLPGYEQWEPRYTDYLFLAFNTAVAFSPADTLPLSRRAKLLMMLQATISVVIVVVVVGTAVNTL